MLHRLLLAREARDACRVMWRRFPPKAAPRAVRLASTGMSRSDRSEELNTANTAARETTANGGKSSRAQFYASILKYTEDEQWDRVLSLFEEMRDHDIEPTDDVYNAAVTACEATGSWKRMAELIQTRQTLDPVDLTDFVSATGTTVQSESGSGGDEAPPVGIAAAHDAADLACDFPATHVNDDEKGGGPTTVLERQREVSVAWTYERSWDRGFALLSRYHAREGHCRVPVRHTEDGRALGTWVARQRTAHRKGKLSAARRERLASLDSTDMISATGTTVQSASGSGGDETPPVGIGPSDAADDAADLACAKSGSEGRVRGRKRWGDQWYHSFALLSSYREREGHCSVPRGHLENDQRLGRWVGTQRSMYRKGKLSAAQKERLESLGMVWKVRVQTPLTWGEFFDSTDLISATATTVDSESGSGGDEALPVGIEPCDAAFHNAADLACAKSGSARRVPDFLATRVYDDGRGGGPTTVLKQLRNVSDAWTHERWNRGFALLSRYHAREGHCRVPARHTEDGRGLGSWVHRQRTAHRKGELSAARQGRLESLGMVWKVRLTWDESFALLSRYCEREGHCRVPQSHAEDGRALGLWIMTQRRAYVKGALGAARKQRLKSLGMVWDPLAQQWERGFELLTAFRDREAHFDVPEKHEEQGVKLRAWLRTQRLAHGKGTLDAARRARLEALGVVWDASEALWETQLERLREFHAREGHCRLFLSEVKHGPWERTYQWLKSQRVLHNRGLLPPERTRPLEALGAFEAYQQHHYPFGKGHRRVKRHRLWNRPLSSSLLS